ncbi:MAG: MBG domain-containing protein, partial [Erysipelotrichaceae bacterium]|nr:MBG domain-containing protein [Erysipelotrichaceae bacterium]
KKAKLAMTAALTISSLSSGMNYVFAQQENKVQENANTEESFIEKEEVVEEKTETVEEEKEELQNQEKATGDVVINENNFPDAIFRKYVSDNFDSDQDDILSSDELNAITRILLTSSRYKELTSVIGIEHFPNLKHLQLESTQVTSVDVSKNLALEVIIILRSPLTNIDVSKNLALRTLNVGYTPITNIDVSKNQNLMHLQIFGANIEGVDITNNPKLIQLHNSSNPLAWLNIGDNPNISRGSLLLKTDGSYNLGVLHDDTFNIQERFPGIDLNRIMSMEGAEIDKTTGIISRYEAGRPIRYTYNCGTIENGEGITLNITLNFKRPSTISINDNLDKEYDGNKVKEPSTTTTGSSGAVTYEWFKKSEDGQWVSLEEAPTNAGNYGVKAYLAEDEYYAAADSGEPTPFTISKVPSNITINSYDNKEWDGNLVTNPTDITRTQNGATVTFKYYRADDTTTEITAPSEVGEYKVKAFLSGDENYTDSESDFYDFSITAAETTITFTYENQLYTGNPVRDPKYTVEGSTGEVTIEWYEANDLTRPLEQAPTNVGSYVVKVSVAGTSTHNGASATASFQITKADSNIVIRDDLSKVYDGEPVSEPTKVETTGSQSKPVYEWYTEDGTKLAEAPRNVGNYKVKAILAGDDNHEGAEVEVEFSISKASNAWTTELSMQGWVYGEEANTPQAEVQFGKITYTYSTSEDGVYTEEVPSDAGTYWVKASVEGTDNYEGLEAKVSFTIEKANSSITIDTDLNKVYDGQPVSEPSITQIGSQSTPVYEWYVKDEGTARTDTWTKLAEAPVEVGSYKLVVSVAEDTNYHGATVEVEFSIKVETVVVPTPPNGGTITNPDGGEIVVKPGDNIESNGPVVENPDGSITFPEGGTVTKPDGSEEVIQPGGVLNPNNPSEEVIETPGESIDGVQTGDTTQTSVWAMLVGLSMSMMYFFRRKKNR